jgi:hypothetical protein
MALTYTETIALVRNWCNRDEEVVSDTIIQDCLRYAADKAYRTLRVPPLENVAIYSATDLESATIRNNYGLTKTEIRLPFDLIEFIQIKELDKESATVRVFNEKLDIRTFNDVNAEKYSNMNYWARQRNMVYLTPGFNSTGTATTLELLYYRRLPALDAKYAVNALNHSANFLDAVATPITSPPTTNQGYLHFTTTPSSTTAYNTQTEAITAATGNVTAITNGSTSASTLITNNGRVGGSIFFGQELSGIGVTANTLTGAPPKVTNVSADQNTVTVDTAQTLDDLLNITFSNTKSEMYIGKEIPNWLRDQNERVILMGSLAEIFSYTQEDDQAQKYLSLFTNEIKELNDEDARRNASGGNLQVNFNGRGLI